MLVKQYLYIDSNHKRRVASVGNERQIAVIYGKLPLYDGKLPSRVAAALAWRGALSSSPFLIKNKNQQSSYYLRTVAT
jgi:hypothetical protein